MRDLFWLVFSNPVVWITALAYACTGVVRQSVDQWFPKYVEQLDGAKLLLLKPHVDALSAYSDRMDDQLREGDADAERARVPQRARARGPRPTLGGRDNGPPLGRRPHA